MTPEIFFHTVAAMRKAQRDYKKKQDPESLRLANDYERMVDIEIKRVQMILKERQNPRLDI